MHSVVACALARIPCVKARFHAAPDCILILLLKRYSFEAPAKSRGFFWPMKARG